MQGGHATAYGSDVAPDLEAATRCNSSVRQCVVAKPDACPLCAASSTVGRRLNFKNKGVQRLEPMAAGVQGRLLRKWKCVECHGHFTCEERSSTETDPRH